MSEWSTATFDDPTGDVPVIGQFSRWEIALQSVSRLAVVFALSLALILVLGHQLGRPV
jgi:hypothetical protein